MSDIYFEDDILDFIELMQKAVPNAIEVFTSGNCGPFSLILAKAFPGGQIKNIPKLGGHRIYEIGGQWYDITGMLSEDFMKKNKLKYEDAEELFTTYGPGKAMVYLRSNYKN